MPADDDVQLLVTGGGAARLVVLFWPVLTAIGLLGYRLYKRGRYYPAHVCLAIYSVTGLSTLAHFLGGTPKIPPFFFATIFTDGLAGLSILAFVVVSARGRARRPATASA